MERAAACSCALVLLYCIPTHLAHLKTSLNMLPCSQLSAKGLKGFIPPDGWLLPDTLQLLDLDSNQLQGRYGEMSKM